MESVVTCLFHGTAWDRAVEGLLGAAERIAQQLNLRHELLAVGLSEAVLERVARSADRVLDVRHERLTQAYQPETCTAAIAEVCRRLPPRLILLGQDTYSQEIAPRLALRLGGTAIGDVQKIDLYQGRIQVTRGVYGGKATAVIRANVDPAVVRLRARAFAPQSPRETAAVIERCELAPASLTSAAPVSRLESREQSESTTVRLEDARIIVSGGRGLGGPEPFDDLRQLAAAMHAELAASRAACDAGWVPAGLQVGQTGKKVAPQLYLAVAISGASQHLMGISDAKTVAAINIDPDAPIFRHCKFGLVDDYRNVVGPLRELIAQKMS